jgi:ribonuclease P protein component
LKTHFSRQQRLLTKNAFQFVFASPLKVKSKWLIALYRSNGLSYARLGLMISKRYLKRAVDRNYLKRILREIFRHHHRDLQGFDIVVMLRRSPETEEKAAWRADAFVLFNTWMTSLSKNEKKASGPC